jgi:hypothetical protein
VAKRLFLQALTEGDFGHSTPAVEATQEVLKVLSLVGDCYGEIRTHTFKRWRGLAQMWEETSRSESTPEALAEEVSSSYVCMSYVVISSY